MAAAALLAGLTLAAGPAAAGEPVRRGPLQLTLGGEVDVALAPEDRDHFNVSEDEGTSLLRRFRATASAELKAGRHLALLGEVRSEDLGDLRVYALYLRVRPWSQRELDVQAGLVPPVFGAFGRRYGADPVFIGYPLAYHYPTLVRADAAPLGLEDLLAARGHGAWLQFPLGSSRPARGLPLMSALHWDTGVQVRLGLEDWQVSAALTQGTLGNPLVRDDNGRKQVAARVGWRSDFGLTAGLSVARGAYAARDLLDSIPDARGQDFQQRALGLDLEQARGHWLVRGEAIWTGWDEVAATAPLLGRRLSAAAYSLEGRYRPWPGLTVGTRVDHLGFSDVPGPAGAVSWDAPVWRVETAVGYALRRNLSFKLAHQHNRRDGESRDLIGVQGVAWF